MPNAPGLALGYPQTLRHKRAIFATAIVVRVTAAALMWLLAMTLSDLSRDSLQYHLRGQRIAETIFTGQYSWSAWIDEGWNQFIGLVYFLIAPHILLIQLFNAVICAWSAVLLYELGVAIFQHEPAARLAAYVFIWFPSLIYYTSLPLKEAVALLSILAILRGILLFHEGRRGRGIRWMLAGFAIMGAIRVYLLLVLAACTLLCLLVKRIEPGWKGVFRVLLTGAALGLVVTVTITMAGVKFSEYEYLRYFDLGYINNVRTEMNSGTGRMFQSKSDAAFGESWVSDLENVGKGVAFFLFSVDITDIRSLRQVAAVPEMLFFIYCLPYLLAGAWNGWRAAPRRVLPLLLFILAIVAVYGGASTNMGAMYRWRLQALPLLLLLISYGGAVRRKGLVYQLVKRFLPRPMGRHRPLSDGVR
jgi:hypothetical protein